MAPISKPDPSTMSRPDLEAEVTQLRARAESDAAAISKWKAASERYQQLIGHAWWDGYFGARTLPVTEPFGEWAPKK